MLLLGIDIGTSSIKVAVVDSATQQVVTSAQFPDEESLITAIHPGWAEQSPEMWWEHVQQAFAICKASGKFNPHDISSIGIAYQIHWDTSFLCRTYSIHRETLPHPNWPG
jgi:xylulokinase